ncbi:MAG: protein kinase [Planctomyces sp.]|nr:protein kinase [Planctomyces sp.]
MLIRFRITDMETDLYAECLGERMTLNWQNGETEHCAREELIFLKARQISNLRERQFYLLETCGGDQMLYDRVNSLLKVDAADRTFLEPGAGYSIVVTDLFPDQKGTGRQLGCFVLEAELGSGGMGVVWLARQDRPVRRWAAIKLMHPGFRAEDRIVRFEVERQMLAAMQHPAIPKLLDAGADESGSPWYAMELVHGVPLTRYCHDQKLTLQNRIRLFADLCDAVQHVHQTGIVHRDLKPGNVLVIEVDGKPMVRLIDFGAAYWHSDSNFGNTSDEVSCLPLGTLAYMSPEQAAGEDRPDVRNDIYSLGAFLYELISESRPIDLPQWSEATTRERRELVRQFYATAPSTRKRSLRQESQAATPAVESDLVLQADTRFRPYIIPQDLDSIVMKALHPDRDRRYATVRDLAADLRRFLNQECVGAHPHTFGYIAEKYWQRKSTQIVIGTFALTALITLICAGYVSWQQRREVEETRRETLVAQARFEAEAARRRVNMYAADMSIGFSARRRGNLSLANERLEDAADRIPSRISGFEQNWLRRLLIQESQMVEASGGRIFDLAVSPDQNRIAIASGDTRCRVAVRSLETQMLEIEIADFVNDVNSVVFSLDGSQLLTADESGFVRIFELPSGRELSRPAKLELPVSNVSFLDNDSKIILSEINWMNLTARTSVIDISSGAILRHRDNCRILDLHPDGELAAVVLDNESVVLMNAQELTEYKRLLGTRTDIGCGVFSDDGAIFAAGTRNGELLIWETEDSELKVLKTPFKAAIRSVAFSPDGQYIVAGHGDGRLSVWDFRRETNSFVNTGEHGACWSLLTLNEAGTLVAGFEDSSVEFREWSSVLSHVRKPIVRSEQSKIDADRVSISADGFRAAVIDNENSSIRFIDLTGEKLECRIPLNCPQKFDRLAFISDDQELAITDFDGGLYRLSIASGDLKFVCSTYNSRVIRPVVSNDGKSIALSTAESPEYRSGIWDLQTGKETFRLPQFEELHAGTPNRIIQFLANHRVLSTKSDSVFTLDVPYSGSTPKRTRFKGSWVFSAMSSPDGKLLAVACEDHSTSLIDRSSGEIVAILQQNDALPLAIDFSSDSELCVTGGFDGTLLLWHVPTAQLLCEFYEARDPVERVKLSNDGKMLTVLTRGEDGIAELIVWDSAIRKSKNIAP